MKELGYFINSDGIKSTFIKKMKEGKRKKMEFEIGTILPKS